MSRLKVFLLGPPQVAVDNTPVEMKRRKAMALLAYLAVIGDVQRRDTLATLLWPDSTQRSARAALRRHLWELNKLLGGDWLQVDRENVNLRFGTDFWLDVAQFQDRLAACRKHGHPESELCPDCLPLLSEAAALYRADFLSGFTLSDSPDFDEWQYFQAESLRQDLGSVLERLARGFSEQGEPKTAIPHARRWLALDPLHEPAHRQLMQIYAQTGQRAQALRQYHECIQLLEQALGAPPQEETVALYERIRQNAAEPEGKDKRDVAIPLVPPSAPARHNLPVQTTRFVGRDAEFERLAGLLADPTVRLLTILGPGGMGKTRLALEAAKAQLDHFEHGVYFVRLAPLDAPESIVSAIAEALSFSSYEGGAPEQQLQDYLREKDVLLLMDSYEHLLEGVEVVIDLLKVAPGLKILATSRASLSVREEQRFPLTGIDFPAETDFEEIGQFGAGQLFLESARRVQPRFELTDKASVARICRLVRGMPLGIILAASWIGLLSPAEIAAELSQSLDFLETDLRDLPERQRSMRAVFDHSWRLLGEREQTVLQQLSIFRGGFTRVAAQAVTGASLRDLMALVSKSLLNRAAEGRYDIHELLRQFAAARLERDLAGSAAVHDRHYAYYTDFLQQREAELKGPRQQEALDEIEADAENAHLAWRWAVDHKQLARLSQAIDCLGRFYEWRGRYQEGETIFRLAAKNLAADRSSDGLRLRTKILTWQAVFNLILGRAELTGQLFQQAEALLDSQELIDRDTRPEKAFLLLEMSRYEYTGDFGVTNHLGNQSLILYRALDDPWGTAQTLNRLGISVQHLDSYAKARLLFEESLDIQRALGNQRGIAYTLERLGFLAVLLGQDEAGENFLRQGFAIRQKIGDLADLALGCGMLTVGLNFLGKFTEARHPGEERLRINKDLGNRSELLGSNLALAHTYLHLGRYYQAAVKAKMSLRLSQEIENLSNISQSLWLLGQVALAEGDYAKARQVLHESIALHRKAGERTRILNVFVCLGFAERGLGDQESAKQHLFTVFSTVAETNTLTAFTRGAFPLAALLLADQEDHKRAVEIYALASSHPYVGNSRWFEDVAGRHIAAVAETLPPEVAAAVQERGQKRDLWETAAELLAELAQN